MKFYLLQGLTFMLSMVCLYYAVKTYRLMRLPALRWFMFAFLLGVVLRLTTILGLQLYGIQVRDWGLILFYSLLAFGMKGVYDSFRAVIADNHKRDEGDRG
jgi:hypothetical protein